MKPSIPRYINLVAVLLSCVSVSSVLSQRHLPGSRAGIPGGPLCAATACTYTVDIGLADCNGRQLTCLPLSFNQAVTLDMGQNSIHRLHRSMLTGYLRLRALDLSNNVINSIEDNAFSSLGTLTTLTLSFNQITRIGVGTLSGLRGIQNLHLQGNGIVSIHAKAFDGLTTLQDLNLAGNRLATLPNSVFGSLFNLRRLMLQENQLSNSNRFLDGLRSLIELDLDGNRFTRLPDLSGMRMLGDLEITDSSIQHIQNDSFSGCGRVKELILASNSIHTIEIGGFNGLHDLTDLHLSANALKTLPEKVFSKMVFLERLFMQNNMLTSLKSSHFATLTRLLVLSVSGNQLSVFPPLPASRSLSTLDLTSNSLTTFTKDVLHGFPVLNRLLLLHNPLQCDCRLLGLRQWFINSGLRHRSNEIPMCDSPTELSRSRLTAASPSGMICTPPSVWSRVTTVRGLEGQNISLDCSGTGGFPSPFITWRAPNNEELLPDVLSGRYLVTDDGPMVIFKARMADSGLFTCVGSNPAGTATAAVALRVSKNPKIPVTGPPVTAVVVEGTAVTAHRQTVTTYVDLITPPGLPSDEGDIGSRRPGWENSPRLPGNNPHIHDEDLYWDEPPCGTHPTKVAAGIFLTFFLTCILCTIFYWSWYHRLLPTFVGRSVNLQSLKSGRLSRNVVPMRSRAATAYNQMHSEGVYLRPNSYSGSEQSYSTSGSFEQDNRYVITESIVDPENVIRRQHMLNKVSPKPSCLSSDSRHTYINADVVTDSNYTALCTKDRSQLPAPPEETEVKPGEQKPPSERNNTDSRIYMDLS